MIQDSYTINPPVAEWKSQLHGLPRAIDGLTGRDQFLYHGTTASAIPSILENGLRPRGRRKGNYRPALASHGSMVYLTRVFAPTYAVRSAGGGGRDVAVVEIDTNYLDPEKLRPDEDFLMEASANSPDYQQTGVYGGLDNTHLDLLCRSSRKKVDRLKFLWPHSLDRLGTVAYRGTIPSQAIRRVATFCPSLHSEFVLMLPDIGITVPSYLFSSQKMAAWTRWLFNGPTSVNEHDVNPLISAIRQQGEEIDNVMLREWADLQTEIQKRIIRSWQVSVMENDQYAPIVRHSPVPQPNDV